MKHTGAAIRLSASDLAAHLGCRHLTALEVAVVAGEIKRPHFSNAALDALIARGIEHERAYVEELRKSGLEVRELPVDERDADRGFEQTLEAMRRGADVITQAWLATDSWSGRADILRRVEKPSNLGNWSYEVLDTKLARETRAGSVLQLCLYSEVVGAAQGLLPEKMAVVIPGDPVHPFHEEPFRVLDYAAYYRLVKGRLEAAVATHRQNPLDFTTYPDPVPHCDVCRWWSQCDKRRRDDDHLCLVANITSLQRNEFVNRSVTTLESLAGITLPLSPRPKRGSPEAFARTHHQARIQLEGRRTGKPRHELLDPVDGCGLAILPEPDPGDVFLDLEGDPFVGTAGREYLFGWVTIDRKGDSVYERRWALTAEEEKAGFEALIDELIERWKRHPGLHVYHYASYEPSALKRLMGRYATREDEIDRMLRGGLFVDLYTVVRQGVRASVERYSIKDLEIFYGYERELDLRDAAPNRRAVEAALELGQATTIEPSALEAVEKYNRDDCISARELRDWLEERRAELVAKGHTVARPDPRPADAAEALSERIAQLRALAERVAKGVPVDPADRSAEQHSRWILAQLLEYYRREAKVVWWEYFRLLELPAEELLDERAAISGLQFIERVEVPTGRKKRPVDRYRFPAQELTLRQKDELTAKPGKTFGIIEAIDPQARTVDVRKSVAFAEEHPDAVFSCSVVGTENLEESLVRLAEWVADHGIDGKGPHRAARDLLLRHPPRLTGGSAGNLRREGEAVIDSAKRLATSLDRSVLPVQGPPGAGKTYTGARMICALVKEGKRVGITAVSHKVIRNLLDEVLRTASEEKITVRCVQKAGESSDPPPEGIAVVSANPDVLAALSAGEAQVGAGTAWLWSRPEYADSVDVLFVDEAGQMSLAQVLSVAQAARSLVLLGDPQQLEQPVQGSHPDGTDVSALEFLLGDHKTIPDDRGLFLPETWRMHPSLCAFTSELFYESRLHPRPDLEQQAIEGKTRYAGAGLRFVPVKHEGNQNASPEEVDAVAKIVAELTSGKVFWIDRKQSKRPVALADILIVAPYNLQVNALEERLPGARVGTVDRFQGQEAPVVIYSMTTSSPEEAPRGMEFLYSPSRLNVATSRARAVCILVANPRLFEPDCRSPRQMQLANAFCRFLEMAETVG